MSQTIAKPTRAERTSKIVDDLLGILQLGTPAPSGDQATPPQPPPQPRGEQERLITGLQKKLDGKFLLAPEGASTAEKAALDDSRSKVQGLLRPLELGDLKLRRADHQAQLQGVAKTAAEQFNKVVADVQDRAAKRKELGDRLLQLVPDADPVPSATPAETKALVDKRKAVETKLAKADTLEGLELLSPEVEQVAKDKSALEDVVQDRLDRKGAVLKAERALADPADAKPDALKVERGKVTGAFGTVLDDAAISAGEKALKDLQSAHVALEAKLVPLRNQRQIGLAQVKKIADRFTTSASAVADGKKGDVKKGVAACEKLLVTPIDEANLAKVTDAIWDLRNAIAACIKANVGNQNAREGLKSYVSTEAKELIDEANRFDDTTKEVTALKKAAKTAFQNFGKEIGGGGHALSKATNHLTTLQDTVGELREQAGSDRVRLMEARNQLLQDIAAKDPAGCAPEYAAKLKTARETVGKTLTGLVTQASVDTAVDQVHAFEQLLKEAEADAAAAKKVDAAKKDLATSFGPAKDKARGPVKVELQRAYDAALANAGLSGDKRDMIGAAKRFAELQARIKETGAEPKLPDTAFDGIEVGGKPVEEAVAKKVVELAGPTLVGGLDKVGKAALCEAVASDGPAIEALLSEGLGGNPKVFASLVQRCGGEGVAELAKAFGESGGRASLLTLMDEGGLAENPAALSAMLQDGVDAAEPTDKAAKRTANAGLLKDVVGQFAGADGAAAMRGLLTGCSLGASPTAGVPPAVGSVLHAGCDGDAGRFRAFADSFAGTDDQRVEDRANLKNLVTKGGVGDHPSVLGPLVKASGVAKLKAVGTAFSGEEDAENLKAVLDGGGMSGDTGKLGKEHEHPDTLAKVFHDGLGDDAAKLKAFATAFKGKADECKGMLDAWNEWPEENEDRRQPGDKVKRLLAANKFNGDVKKLQTVFTSNVKKIGGPEDTRRKQATRFAPHFCTQSASDIDGNLGKGVTKVTASVMKRHKPETFDRSKMGSAALHTQFPPDTDVGPKVTGALAALGDNPDKTVSHQRTIGNIRVEIGFLNSSTVNHFGPRDNGVQPPDPDECPEFTTSDINNILAAIGK